MPFQREPEWSRFPVGTPKPDTTPRHDPMPLAVWRRRRRYYRAAAGVLLVAVVFLSTGLLLHRRGERGSLARVQAAFVELPSFPGSRQIEYRAGSNFNECVQRISGYYVHARFSVPEGTTDAAVVGFFASRLKGWKCEQFRAYVKPPRWLRLQATRGLLKLDVSTGGLRAGAGHPHSFAVFLSWAAGH